MAEQDVVEVMARAMVKDQGFVWDNLPEAHAPNARPFWLECADAALTALEQAGYAVVPRDLALRVIEHADEGQGYMASDYNHTEEHTRMTAAAKKDIDDLLQFAASKDRPET